MRRHVHPHYFFNQRIALQAVFNQVFDGNDLEIKLLRYLFQLRQARHGTIFIQNFHQHTGGFKTCQAGQVHSSLSMPGPAQHATFFCAKRENMTGLAQFFGFCSGIYQCLDGFGAVVRRNTGGTAMPNKSTETVKAVS